MTATGTAEREWCATPPPENRSSGLFLGRYASGQLEAVVEYEAGVLHGPAATYHPTGHLKAEGFFVDGVYDGVWTYYASDGTPERQEAYRCGRPASPEEAAGAHDPADWAGTHHCVGRPPRAGNAVSGRKWKPIHPRDRAPRRAPAEPWGVQSVVLGGGTDGGYELSTTLHNFRRVAVRGGDIELRYHCLDGQERRQRSFHGTVPSRDTITFSTDSGACPGSTPPDAVSFRLTESNGTVRTGSGPVEGLPSDGELADGEHRPPSAWNDEQASHAVQVFVGHRGGEPPYDLSFYNPLPYDVRVASVALAAGCGAGDVTVQDVDVTVRAHTKSSGVPFDLACEGPIAFSSIDVTARADRVQRDERFDEHAARFRETPKSLLGIVALTSASTVFLGALIPMVLTAGLIPTVYGALIAVVVVPLAWPVIAIVPSVVAAAALSGLLNRRLPLLRALLAGGAGFGLAYAGLVSGCVSASVLWAAAVAGIGLLANAGLLGAGGGSDVFGAWMVTYYGGPIAVAVLGWVSLVGASLAAALALSLVSIMYGRPRVPGEQGGFDWWTVDPPHLAERAPQRSTGRRPPARTRAAIADADEDEEHELPLSDDDDEGLEEP